jgi:hypothetical protein
MLNRTLNILAGLIAIGITAFVHWQSQPDVIVRARSHLCTHPTEADVPAFAYGAFQFQGDPWYQIAYLALIQEESNLSTRPHWLEREAEEIFIAGRRVRPRTGIVQLFVSEGSELPQLIELTDGDARTMQTFLNEGQNYDSCQEFWNDLANKYHFQE